MLCYRHTKSCFKSWFCVIKVFLITAYIGKNTISKDDFRKHKLTIKTLSAYLVLLIKKKKNPLLFSTLLKISILEKICFDNFNIWNVFTFIVEKIIFFIFWIRETDISIGTKSNSVSRFDFWWLNCFLTWKYHARIIKWTPHIN